MNIVVNGRFSQYKTGVGRVVENYLRHLAPIDDRNRYHIYVNPEFVDLFRFDNPNFIVHSNGVPAGNSLKNHLWTQTGLLWNVRRHQADLLILPQINLVLFKLAPILLFQHDLIEYHLANQVWYKMLFRKFAIPYAIKLANRIVSVSNNTTNDLRCFLGVPDSKVVTILSGVHREGLGPQDRDECRRRVSHKYKIDGEYILYVGTLTLPQKNLLRLVEAYRLLRNRGCQAQLLLAGAFGKESHRILELIESLGLRQHTITPGYVDEADLPYLYSGATAFCFPSLYEGFGLPVLEAMACGCPVVTSNVSSMPEIAGEAAALVDPNDSKAIADALWALLCDPELRRQRAEQGLAQAARFSWDKAARQLLDVINSFNGTANHMGQGARHG